MTRRNVRKQEWVFPLFSPDSDDRLSLNFHRFVVLYISCDTRSVGLGQHCLPKVYNGFKRLLKTMCTCSSAIVYLIKLFLFPQGVQMSCLVNFTLPDYVDPEIVIRLRCSKMTSRAVSTVNSLWAMGILAKVLIYNKTPHLCFLSCK